MDVSDRRSLSTSFEWNMFSDDVDDTLGGDDDDDDDLAGLCRLDCEFRDELRDATPWWCCWLPWWKADGRDTAPSDRCAGEEPTRKSLPGDVDSDGPSADREPPCSRLVPAHDEADDADALSLEHSDTRRFRFDL